MKNFIKPMLLLVLCVFFFYLSFNYFSDSVRDREIEKSGTVMLKSTAGVKGIPVICIRLDDGTVVTVECSDEVFGEIKLGTTRTIIITPETLSTDIRSVRMK